MPGNFLMDNKNENWRTVVTQRMEVQFMRNNMQIHNSGKNKSDVKWMAKKEGWWNSSTYHDLSYKQIGLFFSDSKISGHGDVKLRVIIIDIGDDYVHSGSGCLKKKKHN